MVSSLVSEDPDSSGAAAPQLSLPPPNSMPNSRMPFSLTDAGRMKGRSEKDFTFLKSWVSPAALSIKENNSSLLLCASCRA
uniref:Zinc finger family protein n=1 Tax=Rhizophora mucronata TaxID=61149 RepID=A0A2P2Q7X2_RHIMU